MTPSTAQLPSSRGFTLIELVVVVGVIAALAAIGIPTLLYMRHKGDVAATESVIQAMTTALVEHQQKSMLVLDGGEERVFRLWDMNSDGILDGDPAEEAAILDAGDAYPDPPLAADPPYAGPVAMTAPTLPERFVDEYGRILDAWQRPLRIAFDPDAYGAHGFGIYSVGEDGVAAPLDGAVEDDVRGWEVGDDD